MSWRPAWYWRKRGVGTGRDPGGEVEASGTAAGRPAPLAGEESGGEDGAEPTGPEGDAAHQAELSVVPAVLAELPLAGRIVTGDALYCQRAICQQVLAAQGDYLFVVKANQPELLEALVLLFDQPPLGECFGQAQSAGLHGDRYEERHLLVSTALTAYLRDELGWPAIRQVLRVERRCRQQGEMSCEMRYLITSLSAKVPPRQLLALVRGHWWIENKLHYVRDVTMGEDACQVRSAAAPQVLAAWRRAAVALLRLNGWTTSAAGLREGAWRPGTVLRLLGLPSG